jgi:hypothetical protein
MHPWDTLRRNPEWVKGSALRNGLVERLDDAVEASMRIEKPKICPQCCGGCEDPDAHTIVHENPYALRGINALRAYPREEFVATCEKFNREKLLDRGFQCRAICTLPPSNEDKSPCVLLLLVIKRSDAAHDELFHEGKEAGCCMPGFQTRKTIDGEMTKEQVVVQASHNWGACPKPDPQEMTRPNQSDDAKPSADLKKVSRF